MMIVVLGWILVKRENIVVFERRKRILGFIERGWLQ